MQLLSPSPAFAKAQQSLASKSQSSAAELQGILASRGAALPSLKASPNAVAPRPPSEEFSAGSEILRQLRRESKENERLRAELEASQKALTTGGAARVAAPTTSFSAPAAAPAPAAPAVSKPAESSPKPKQEEQKEEESNPISVLNIFGIVAAGVLGGYLTIQNKEKTEVEAAYQTQLKSE